MCVRQITAVSWLL